MAQDMEVLADDTSNRGSWRTYENERLQGMGDLEVVPGRMMMYCRTDHCNMVSSGLDRIGERRTFTVYIKYALVGLYLQQQNCATGFQ